MGSSHPSTSLSDRFGDSVDRAEELHDEPGRDAALLGIIAAPAPLPLADACPSRTRTTR
jgi:hypothetical protein